MKRLGLELELKINKRMDGIYSATLTDKDTMWNTCGKGTTDLFCAASAYGKSVEHLKQCYDIDKVILHAVETRKCQDYEWAVGFDRWFGQTYKYKNYKGERGIVVFSKNMEWYENIILENTSLKKIIIKREV